MTYVLAKQQASVPCTLHREGLREFCERPPGLEALSRRLQEILW